MKLEMWYYTLMKTPFYDPLKSYDDNYDKGPFGSFSDGKVHKETANPKYTFLGHQVNLPFGIPAGPLLNSKFVKAAFEKGFDIPVYKTVRSGVYPTHPFPNVLAVHVDGDLTLEKAQQPLVADNTYEDPISITNSFGVPSKDPAIWQEDAKKAIEYAGSGQVMVLSFMGTTVQNQTAQELISDFAHAAKLSFETGAKILEVNLSCPNIGNEGLVCYNLEMTKNVLKAIRGKIDNTPLIVKVGYYKEEKDLERLSEIVAEYANSISAINTISAQIVDKEGNQALPGNQVRFRSGVCGACIKWAGLDMVKKLYSIKEKNGYKFSIEGVGGVTKPEDYFEYKNAGADAVFSATGAMWNPDLAIEIKEALNKKKS